MFLTNVPLLLQSLHIQPGLSQFDLSKDQVARRGCGVAPDSNCLLGICHVDPDNSIINNGVMELLQDNVRLLFVGHGDESKTLTALVVEDDLGIQDCSKPAEQLHQVVLSGV